MAHAESLTAHLQYYMPTLEGVPDLPRLGVATAADFNGDGAGTGASFGELRAAPDDAGDAADYMDHLQQPGNTKKRKVPLNMAGFPIAQDHRGDDGADESPERDGSTDGRYAPSGPVADSAPDGTKSDAHPPKKKLSRATLAGLQHKELLKSRKDQLAGVITPTSLADPLALDQALSSNFPFTNSTNGETRVRLSRRKAPRLSRIGCIQRRALPAPTANDEPSLPTADFTFQCQTEGEWVHYRSIHNIFNGDVYALLASARQVSIREEIARLHDRFEAELIRQAAKAAEEAKEASLALANARPKRSDRQQQRARMALTGGAGGDQNASFLEQSLLGTSASKKKKKKRSALANASNPHHLRNYVPSRLPHSGFNATQSTQNTQNTLGPLPLRFLAAEIGPDRRAKDATPASAAPSPPPGESANEWICPFCEYNLFYGDDLAFRRAVRSRKKILKRRRRARERAAAAASGKAMAPAPASRVIEEDEEALFEPPHDDVPASIASQMKWKGERNRDADRRVDNQARGGGSG